MLTTVGRAWPITSVLLLVLVGCGPEAGDGDVSPPVVVPGSTVPVLNKVSETEGLVVNSIGMAFVEIPAGEFWMGSLDTEAGRFDDENRHKVQITRPFQIGAYEVTVANILHWLNDPQTNFKSEWIELTDSYCPVKKVNNRFELTGGRCQFGQSEDQPMVVISYDGANAFCAWLNLKEPGQGYRLPTEAEWEYAARAGSTTPFPWGGKLNGKEANVDGNYPYGTTIGPYLGCTAKVGSYAPNAWGLFDTVGNVWEWCDDWYNSDYYSASGAGWDPKGPVSGSSRVIRGGCWVIRALNARSEFRSDGSPSDRIILLGFRVARGTSSK